NTRQWAYRAIREYWAPNYKRKWNAAVYDKVESTNSQFNVPLPVSEVKAIAKSIANWTYREFTPEKFRQSQARKGAKGGKASKGGGRRSERDKLLPEVKKLKSQGKSNRAIADLLNIGSATVSRWLK
ncbi:primase C-terminal domain-containing protein, partial [Vibrio parahaemolyticus]|uniref:primase C-terminal domain-containing protein n=1 Tax=Vibrio parahaemolyticus TaxID=670 RepID=UPI00146ADDED